MEFALTEEQQELAADRAVAAGQARGQRSGPRSHGVRRGYDEALWQTLCEQIGAAALADPRGVRRRRVLAVRDR